MSSDHKPLLEDDEDDSRSPLLDREFRRDFCRVFRSLERERRLSF